VVYFYTRYFFASAMAHISAMYLAFLAVAVSVGVPPLFAALVLGYTSNLSMGLTQYSGGPGPALFGSGYNTTGQWWGVSFVVSLASIAIWLVLGGVDETGGILVTENVTSVGQQNRALSPCF
jgi:DASS family divalent anion:Na+ symporter